ncbi:MAG TPA: DsbA family protein [Verrucomicrobiae bacterium]|nr:DsbA family protein [Verrucomicrobiae bacterium]
MNDGLFHHALAVPVSGDDHVQGPDSAAVTLVLYGDYQCPYTAALHQVVTRLQVRFGENLRYVFRHFPLFAKHPKAQLAAETAEAASAQGKFWQMHAYLFQAQYDFDRERLGAACSLLGLDYVRLDSDISNHVHLEHIQKDVAGAKSSGVASTPTLFVNGFMYDADDDFETLSRNVESLVPMTNEPKRRPFWRGLFGN